MKRIVKREKKTMADVTEVAEVPEKTPVSESGSIQSEVRSLSPEYVYTTDQKVEDFNTTPFVPPAKPRNDLSPINPIKPDRPRGNDGRPVHDEHNDYQQLGLFNEQVRYIFDPELRSDVNKTRKPLSNLYEQGRDDTQLDVNNVIRTECKCKNGKVVMGWLDTTTGKKDCSPCQQTVFAKPNIYKNYRTKKVKPNFENKRVPLRKQVGVSHFGDVNMKGCQTGNAKSSLEKVNAVSTLNNVVNIDTIDSRGGAEITTSKNNSGLPFTMYDNDPTNIYGVI
jgi:hypothetical protein